MNEKDLVIGFITGYNYDKLKPWVNSLLQSGFTGDKFMVVYNINFEVTHELESKGFNIIGFNRDNNNQRWSFNEPFNIVVSRFEHLWHIYRTILKSKNYRYIISTDVADVIFQTNPSEWLEQNLGNKKLCVGGESLRYVDEPWGMHNMYASFGPLAADFMHDKPIHNAGTIAGTADCFVDLCYNISLLCRGAPLHVPGGGGPDQAALNLLLNMEHFKDITLYNNHDSGWACQCGTTVDPTKMEQFRPHLLSPEPHFDGEYVYTSGGKKFVLVHQYNRVPTWKEKLERKYG